MTAASEVPEGVNPASLRPGSLIDVETKSRHYRIECLGGSAIRISGHPEYCLTPVAAHLHGSIDSEGALDLGLIEPGRRVMFFLNGNRPLTTSRVVSVHVDQPKAVQSSSSSIH
ncbi:MAG: hypothetical protein ABSG41_29575 [Bryobacteraceae bacterium]|jgi:hypothetical protein